MGGFMIRKTCRTYGSVTHRSSTVKCVKELKYKKSKTSLSDTVVELG